MVTWQPIKWYDPVLTGESMTLTGPYDDNTPDIDIVEYFYTGAKTGEGYQ